MDGKFFSKFFAVIITMLLSVSVYAQENEVPNAIDDCNVILGAGLLFHSYSEVDDFRKATGSTLINDEIKWAAGVQFNAELLLNDTFSLSLPVGLAVGYRFQTMEGGYKKANSLVEVETKVQLTNNIGYVNVLIPIDDEKYWLFGCSAGLGASTYKYTEDWSAYVVDVNKTSKGTVVPLSVFFDWGADGIGARFGYTYVMSKYADVDGKTPKGNGGQLFLDLRYAI